MLYFFISAWKLARCIPVSSALRVAFQALRLSVSTTKSFSMSSTDFSRAIFFARLRSSLVLGTCSAELGRSPG